MAGVSESPFRRLCRRFGADVVVTEFLSAEGIRRENEATIAKLRFGPDERPIGVQIFGADPDRKSTRLNSSHVEISYAVFCLKKKMVKDVEQQLRFFWRPEEVNLPRHRVVFCGLTEREVHMFLSNFMYHTLIDSVSVSSPNFG